MAEPGSRKVEMVGKDKVKVEFTIDELVNKAIFNPGVTRLSCGGCNHCMAAALGEIAEKGPANG